MSKPKRAHAGRPPFEPSDAHRNLVQVFRGNGIPLTTIARNVGCDVTTLRKYFKSELTDGHGQVVASLSAALVRAGMAGNVHAIKYWLSTHGGPEWRVSEGREVSGKMDVNVNELSTAELERERDALRARQDAVDRANDLASTLPGKPAGILH